MQDLTRKVSNTTFANFVTNWNLSRQQAGNDLNQIKNLAVQQLDQLKNDLPQLTEYTEEEIALIKSFNLDKFFGKSGVDYISSIQKQLQTTGQNAQSLMQTFVNELNQAKNRPNQIFNALLPLQGTTTNINKSDGIIEVVFDGKVQISNISDGKEQIGDWFLIIDGYAHLFNVRREDFEIISISKGSPTRIKFKTKIEIAASILAIIASIISIEQQYASDRIMVEQLKSRILVSDSLQQQFMKEAEERLSKNVEREINRIVDNKVQEQRIDTKTRSDIVSSFQKGVEKQYNFIINGGDVKFYLGDPTENEKSTQLESSKKEVQQLKENLENIKALNASNGTTDTTATEENVTPPTE